METVEKKRIYTDDLVKSLREKILKGEFQEDIPILSTKELSVDYSASYLTANKALNQLVDEKILYRVKGRGTFLSKHIKTKTIGLIFNQPALGDSDSIHIAFEIYEESLMQQLNDKKTQFKKISSIELKNNPNALEGLTGLIISATILDKETLKILKKFSKPIVMIRHEEHLELPFHQVIPNLKIGMQHAMKHLKKYGKEKLLILGVDSKHSELRRSKAAESAKEMGFSPENIIEMIEKKEIGDLGRMAGRLLGEKILNEHKNCAIFSTSDFLSFGVVDVFKEHSINIPQDFILASYDDLEGHGCCPFGEPYLTTIINPRKKVATEAIHLFENILQQETEELYTIRVPMDFLVRKSTIGENKEESDL